MPGVFIKEINQSQVVAVSDGRSSKFLVVGTANFGPLGISVLSSTKNLAKLGVITKSDLGLLTAKMILNNGGTVHYYRVAGSTKKKAEVTANSAVKFIAKYEGTDGNLLKVTVATGVVAGTLNISVSYDGSVVENFYGYKLTPITDAKYIEKISSNYITVDDLGDGATPSITNAVYTLITGNSGVTLAEGSTEVTTALDEVLDIEALDVDIILAPGYTDSGVISKLVTVAEGRKVSLGLADAPLGLDATDVVAYVNATGTYNTRNALNNSYVAIYWPWVEVYDADLPASIWMPPSAIAAQQYAASDRASFLWFAPAGPKRGLVTVATSLEYELGANERTTMYENNINPIIKIPGTGIVIYGQKTSDRIPNAMDRVNARRTLNYIKKQIRAFTEGMVFDPNDEVFYETWKNAVNRFLQGIQDKRGLTKFKTIMDSSIVTPEMLALNKVPGKIIVTMKSTAEDIELDFIITAQGVKY